MSDIFNPRHYLDKKLLNQPPKEIKNFDVEHLLKKRLLHFNKFKFIITYRDKIIFPEKKPLEIDDQKTLFKFTEDTYLIKITDASSDLNYHVDIKEKCRFIYEEICIEKSNSKSVLTFQDDNEFYYLNNHISPDLLYSEMEIFVNNKLNSYFITNNNEQKHKTELRYNLTKKSNLKHVSFAEIKQKQMQDDSIEVFHSNNSNSEINYNSINFGKISTQVNSVIEKDSFNSNTKQLLKHIVIGENAITNSKPNLVIKNKNVSASHGNSIGNFSKEDLFYLQQRGLDEKSIYKILSKSIFMASIEESTIKDCLLSYKKEFQNV